MVIWNSDRPLPLTSFVVLRKSRKLGTNAYLKGLLGGSEDTAFVPIHPVTAMRLPASLWWEVLAFSTEEEGACEARPLLTALCT